MFIAELVDITASLDTALNEEQFKYCKDLLQDIGRIKETNNELERLDGATCWPCRLPSGDLTFRAMGDFYANDRQPLFEIFSSSQTFLDLDFNQTQKLSDLLRRLDCVSFLSEQVEEETDACQPLQYDIELTQNYQGRAAALAKYVHFSIPVQQYIEGMLTWGQILRAQKT
jgi:hypothetical protein